MFPLARGPEKHTRGPRAPATQTGMHLRLEAWDGPRDSARTPRVLRSSLTVEVAATAQFTARRRRALAQEKKKKSHGWFARDSQPEDKGLVLGARALCAGQWVASSLLASLLLSHLPGVPFPPPPPIHSALPGDPRHPPQRATAPFLLDLAQGAWSWVGLALPPQC